MPDQDRRSFLVSGTLASVVAPLGAKNLASNQRRIEQLRVGMRNSPLGIDDHRPRFSWRLSGKPTGNQIAYRILVASTSEMLCDDKADIWDSGKVNTARCTGIGYRGNPLRSRQSCHWKVQVWWDDGAFSTSDAFCWEMGLLEAGDWAGEWIAVESDVERDDRLAGAEWVEEPVPSPNDPRHFDLEFASGAGEAIIVLASDGLISDLSLDGISIALPSRDPNAFGGPPAFRTEVLLDAGTHLLKARVAPIPGYFSSPTVKLAGQVRHLNANGQVARISNGWQSSATGKPGSWTPAARAGSQTHFPWPPTPARLFRRSFHCAALPERARLYVCALGGFRLWINGRRVGSDELQPEPSLYSKRIPYRVYDVSELLKIGENVIGTMIGDGYFASYQAPDGRYAYGPAPRRFRAMLELASNGEVIQRITTDYEWRHAIAHVTMSEIYAGEDQDLRLWTPGWNEAGFNDTGWSEVWGAPAPNAALSAPLADPVSVVRKLPPRSIRRSGPKSHIVDFGQNFAGRVRLMVAGSPGDRVIVRYAEILDADGALDRRNLRAARATDSYILPDSGRSELLEPEFTYQGFRFVEVEGIAELTSDMIEGLELCSSLPEIGTFRTGQPQLQKLWLNTLWSQRSNFMGIPTDCPQRDERLGWTGDARIFWPTGSFNMDTGAFTRSFTRILRDNQGKAGAFPLWAPSPGGLGWGTNSPTPGWANAGVELPYVAYLHSGDGSIIDENWGAMSTYIDGIIDSNPDLVWRKGRGADLGDWLSLDATSPADATTPKDLVATAMLSRSVGQLAQMAEWSGRTSDAATRRKQHAGISAAFAEAFVDDQGNVGNNSQTSLILAIAHSLVPPNLLGIAGERLADDIRDRGTILSTGFLGTPLALDVLDMIGEHSLAVDLLLRRDFPSWGYMIARGATTMWERWNGDTGDASMNSFNHYALGSVCAFLYRRIAGVEPVEPGFRKFKIMPLMDRRIGSAGTSLDCVLGRIESNWSIAGNEARLELTVPNGTMAEVNFGRRNETFGPGQYRLVEVMSG